MTILAGPNGAGKSTLAKRLFADEIASDRFLNADDIARDLSPGNVDAAAMAAGRALLLQRQAFVAAGRSFVVETTLATRTLMRSIREAHQAGFTTGLIYVWLPDADACIERVAHRVSRGGHFIPSETVKRRFERGLQNLPRYIEAVDRADIFENQSLPRLVFQKRQTEETIYQPNIWARILDAAGADS